MAEGPLTREAALAMDEGDELAFLREAFALPKGVVYLDGNSLGALPRTAAARVREVVEREWGERLIRSWNESGWIELPAASATGSRGSWAPRPTRSRSPTRRRSTCSSCSRQPCGCGPAGA